ncbi:hypothetical protein [Chromobacterium amazonense]|uniref:Uncharacterized protein n=1 Tax=Chromobacterium amazonense TaxID=1382803 RepID=A0ABU8UZ21_9NEIS|nr:hypothetical protein [Chromobacterium amazonense]MDQ4539825.1 hypothetical protein [Chromobacterium amazonense]
MKKWIAIASGLASIAAHGAVIECKIDNTESTIFTSAQFCPAGTTYKRMMLNVDDPGIAAIKAQSENRQPIRVTAPRYTCDQLRAQRDYLYQVLDPRSVYHDRESQPLTKLHNIKALMNEQHCKMM